ncbi:hypothetical protein M0805_006408 [Coniferiporia weirii]|nr:hypothetical protein M0805_006408 [Coniferiporia weirii]
MSSGTTDACVTVSNVSTCLTRLQSAGLSFVAEAGFISMASLLLLFILIIRNVVRYYRNPPRKWSLVQEPADAYVLSLFVADMMQAVGAFMDVRWVHKGSVEIGRFCTAQGTMQQLGETSVAMATMVIAIHTFVVVWFRKGAHDLKVACAVIAVTWLFVILFVAIAASRNRNYYTPTPYWCWIGSHFLGERLGGEYVWLWITLVFSVLLYVPLFLWSRGYLSVDEKKWWRVSARWKACAIGDEDISARVRPDAPSLALLAYPCAYSVVVLPVSIARWVSFNGHHIPDAATFFSVFLHDMFGAVNVLLLLTTRPGLLLFEDPGSARRARLDQGGQGRAPGVSPSRERSGVELPEFVPQDDESSEDHLGVSRVRVGDRGRALK